MQEIAQERMNNAMKEMLATAVAFGMAVAEKRMSGELYDADHVSLIEDIGNLADAVVGFLDAGKLNGTKLDDILPLYREIVTQLPARAA